jgi:hypothetical protein
VTGSVEVAPSGSKVVVPSSATSVVVTATVAQPSGAGFMSVRPGGASGALEPAPTQVAAASESFDL